MNAQAKPLQLALAAAMVFGLGMAPAHAANPCNPCAAKTKNPCGAKAKNPCAAKNPCGAGAKIDPKAITRPAGYKSYKGDQAALLKEGKALWSDTKLSTNGLSCNTCHQGNAAFNASFAKPYPHFVQMTQDQAGLKKVHLDEMVQACLVMPMAAKPLAWGSRELAALTAYTAEMQKSFKPAKGLSLIHI